MKKYNRYLIAFFLWLFLCVSLRGTNISCVPIAITQPDGTSIVCFVSGFSGSCGSISRPEFCGEYFDGCPYIELCSTYHDADGYPFIRNDKEYYCYAIVENDGLKASDYVVGEVDPKLISELKPHSPTCAFPDIQNFLGKYHIEYITSVNKGDGYKEIEGVSGAYEIEITAYQENQGIQFFFDQRGIDGYVKAIVHSESDFEIFGQAFPYTHSARTIISGNDGNIREDSIFMRYHIYDVNDENMIINDTLYVCRGKKIDIGVSEAPLPGLFAAYPQNNGIVVQNVPEGEVITVYNAVGVLAASVVADGSEVSVALPGRGVYVVKAMGKAVKVVL